MIRNVVSLIIIIASIIAIALFAGPQYQEIQELRVSSAELDQALVKAAELRAAREELLARRNSFAQTDIDNLETLVPSNIDNVRLSNDLNALALKHRLILRDFTVTDGVEAITGNEDDNTTDNLGTATIQFSTTGRYQDFVNFVLDIEKSLRIMDVQQISFDSLESQNIEDGRLVVDDVYEYQVTFSTYWLRA